MKKIIFRALGYSEYKAIENHPSNIVYYITNVNNNNLFFKAGNRYNSATAIEDDEDLPKMGDLNFKVNHFYFNYNNGKVFIYLKENEVTIYQKAWKESIFDPASILPTNEAIISFHNNHSSSDGGSTETIDLSKYVTNTKLQKTLSNYYNKEEIDNKLKDLLTDEDLNNFHDSIKIEIIDEVKELINDIQTGDIDLSNYYNKSEIDNIIQELRNLIDSNTNSIEDILNKLDEKLSIDEFNTFKEELENRLNNITVGDVDLSDYYNKSEIDEKFNDYTSKTEHESFKTEINDRLDNIAVGDVDLSGYYNKEEIDNKLNDYTSKVDHETFKEEINNRLDNLDLGDIDLSNYYNKPEIDEKFDGYTLKDEHEALKTEINERFENLDLGDVDLSNYVQNEQLNSVKEEILEIINNINIPEVDDNLVTNDKLNEVKASLESIIQGVSDSLSNYATKELLQITEEKLTDLIQNIQTGGDVDLSNYVTLDKLKALELELKNLINNVDLSDYYNKSEIDDMISDVSIDLEISYDELSNYYNQV